MELTNEFTVPVPVTRAWEVLTDVELIAPCLPGAQLQEIEGDEYRGIVKVKVGPVTAQYKGAARFVERDEGGHKLVLRAEGRETRGQGNANATITAQLTPDGEGTAVSVVTDLTVTGRVAQFGRGVMADVSSKLLGQFVDCLENKTCVVTKDIGDDLVGLDIDRELLDHQRETWANLAQVNGLIRAKVVLEGDTTDVAGNAGTSSILSVLCDGKQVRRINWEDVDANGVKRLCDWQQEVNID